MSKRDSEDMPAVERSKMLDRSPDDSVLTGWYKVVNWVLRFILADPIDATFLKEVSKADVIESIDLYIRYEPQVAVLYAAGMLFFATGIVGSVLYPLVRRRGLCGGDRTQDLNENMRCILQVYTAAYIVVLACILLGGMLMLASIFELKQSSSEHKKGFAEYANAVRLFFLGMAKVAKEQQDENVRYLNELHRTLTDFSMDLRNHLLPMIKAVTVSASGLLKAENSDLIPPVADIQLLESSRLAANKDAEQDSMALLIATEVTKVYNDSLFECRIFAKDGSDRIARFCQAVIDDIDKSSRSFANLSSSLVKSDQLGILETLRSKGHWYVFLVLGSFLFLFMLYTGSFILGMFHYNEDIPPTKRTDASNYAGTAMLVAIVLSFPVCAALMLVSNTIMLLSLSITNFGCRPYENIVVSWPGSTVDVMVLDDMIDLFWPRESRGRWFGSFLAGTTLQKCRHGKVFDVIGADYKLAVDGYDEFLDNLHHLMISITVDPRLIFPATAPTSITNYYDSMKQALWDKVGDMVEGFIRSLARGAVEMRSNLTKFNPECLPAYVGYERAIGYICEGIIRNVNSFWTSLAFCLYMFTFLGTLSHFVSKYFLRMENYTYDGSEVESLTSTTEFEQHAGKAVEGPPECEITEVGERIEFEASVGPDALKRIPSEETDAEGPRIEKGPKWRRGRRAIPPASKLQRMELGDIQDDPHQGVVTVSFMTISSTRSFRPK